MQSHHVAIAVAVAAALCGSGCTVIKQANDNHATEQRISEKQSEVEREQAREAELRNEMTQLSSELATRKMTARELDLRLAELQRRNDALVATNTRQKQLTAEARAKLAQYRTQLAALQRAPNQSDQQTQAQIAALRAEIRKRLAVLAEAE